jgi:hypothetical protein
MRRKSGDLAAKVLRVVRAREQGKRAYKRADALIAELVKEMEPGQTVKVSAEKAYQLLDKFAGKEIVWNPCAARRWEFEEVPVFESKG